MTEKWEDKPCYVVRRRSDQQYNWVIWNNYHEAKDAIHNDKINHRALGVARTKKDALAEVTQVTGGDHVAISSLFGLEYYKLIRRAKVATRWESIEYDLPRYSTCSLGKNRWFWLAWAEGSRNGQQTPNEYLGNFESVTCEGYARTKDEATAAAKQAVGDEAVYQGAMFANACHKEKTKKQRKINATATETTPAEYVYRLDGAKRRIVKKTRQRVYVLVREGEEKTFVLDRHDLETDGEAYSRQRWTRGFYYTEAKYREVTSTDHAAQCFKDLGLTSDATEADIRKAYKVKAKELHPDKGGSESDFIKLKESHDQALYLVKNKNNRRIF